MKKRYRPSYFIGQAFRSLWRNGVMSFASIAVLMSCLVVMGGFYLLVRNINTNIDKINDLNQIVVFCEPDASEKDILALEESIQKLDGIKIGDYETEHVETDGEGNIVLEDGKPVVVKEKKHGKMVSRITKFTGLDSMKEQSEDRAELYSEVNYENNPLSDKFVITYDNREGAVETLGMNLRQPPEGSGLEGIRKVSARIDIAQKIMNFKNSIQWIFIWFLIILFVVTIFIIINTIKLAVHSRRHEISVMRYVGATGWFITLPFIFEGVIIGATASIIAFFAEKFVYGYIEKSIANKLSILDIIPFGDIGLTVFLGFVAVGIITGIVGSCISLGKYLKS